jgi:hypothetical protein
MSTPKLGLCRGAACCVDLIQDNAELSAHCRACGYWKVIAAADLPDRIHPICAGAGGRIPLLVVSGPQHVCHAALPAAETTKPRRPVDRHSSLMAICVILPACVQKTIDHQLGDIDRRGCRPGSFSMSRSSISLAATCTIGTAPDRR